MQDSRPSLFPKGGLEPTVLPGEKPAKNVACQKIERPEFVAAFDRLCLKTVKPGTIRATVLRNWGEQFVNLQNQISGTPPLPRGAEAQVYDRQALIEAGGQHPVEPDVRRVGALLDALEAEQDRGQFESLRADFEIELSALSY